MIKALKIVHALLDSSPVFVSGSGNVITSGSAAANAENNFEMDHDKLYVAQISVNQGPTMKRWRAGAQGRAGRILKRSSHITVVLKER